MRFHGASWLCPYHFSHRNHGIMNCNGQPITAETAETIEAVNKLIEANKLYIQMYLAWLQLCNPWTYLNK